MKEIKGFTLIELLVVFSFIGILTSLGIASYSSYTSSQSVQTAATNFVTLLRTAQSRSISQVIPSACTTYPVTAYEVDITPGGQKYTFSALCNGKQQISTTSLPFPVTFTAGSTPSVIFTILSGTAVAPATMTITGYGKTKTISVSQIGNVTMQ